MTQLPVGFTLDTLTRKKIEKWRRKQKDARLHNRVGRLLTRSRLLPSPAIECTSFRGSSRALVQRGSAGS